MHIYEYAYCNGAGQRQSNNDICEEASKNLNSALTMFDSPSQTVVETACGPTCRPLLEDVATSCGAIIKLLHYVIDIVLCQELTNITKCI